jgi:excisionase family DNA binding protein
MRLEAGAFGPSAGAQPTPSAGAALLKVAEAAEQLAVSRAKLYRLISAGQVRVVRIGSSVRIPRHEIDLLAAG